MTGNTDKFLSYREAWRRISAAIDSGFFLEAIAIEESIIFDRLRSFVEFASAQEFEDTRPLSKLITRYEDILNTDFKKERRWTRDKELIQKLRLWADRRNRAVHQIVRSVPGTPTQPIDQFLEEAEATAKDGAVLARAVSDWFRKHKKTEDSEVVSNPQSPSQ